MSYNNVFSYANYSFRVTNGSLGTKPMRMSTVLHVPDDDGRIKTNVGNTVVVYNFTSNDLSLINISVSLRDYFGNLVYDDYVSTKGPSKGF